MDIKKLLEERINKTKLDKEEELMRREGKWKKHKIIKVYKEDEQNETI
jgi:hypothetical protein